MAAYEEQQLRQVQSSGSRDALRDLLVAHQDRIYNACYQVLGRAEDAEDAAQDALMKLAAGLVGSCLVLWRTNPPPAEPTGLTPFRAAIPMALAAGVIGCLALLK